MLIRAETLSEAYDAVLRKLLLMRVNCSPRGQPCREIRNAMIFIDHPSSKPIVTADAERNEKIARYTAAEFSLYERGVDSVTEFAKHAPFWLPLANRDGTVNSAYGKIVWKDRVYDNGTKTPWEWARESLLNDRDTRQAVLLFAQPRHFVGGVADLVCTMHGAFAARGGKLNLTMVMRSNDAVRGFVYDAPWFCLLLERMRDELAAGGIEFGLGSYAHVVHSLHLYERDVDVAGRMVR